MKKHAKTSAEAAELRRRAESRLREKKKAEEACPRTAEDTQRLVHELEVHQIELEMQNEELRQARAEVEMTLGQYTDLYDFAPTGCFTLDRDGTIRQVSLTGASLLGVERARLTGRRFGLFVSDDSRPAFNTFLDTVFAGAANQSCDLALRAEGSEPLFIHLSASVSEDKQVCRAAVVDITERKRAEEALTIQARTANIFLTVPDDEMFNEVLKVILDVMHSRFGVFGFIDKAGALVVPTMTRQIWAKCRVPKKTIRFPRKTWGDSSWPRAIREKKANYSNTVSTEAPEGHVTITRHINVPILFHDEVIGLFQVANKETDYTEADVRTLETIAGHVAPLLSARLRRERAEANQQLAVDVLRLLNRPNNLTVLVEELMRLIKKSLDFDAVGLRVRQGEDFPYYMQNGFSDAFVRVENSLCAKDHEGMVVRDAAGKAVLECMCGNILCGRTDPAQSFFTPGGSFWTNSTTELLASIDEEDRQGHTRNRCNSAGYESVALIPLRSGDEIIGLLQLNDHQRGRFTPEVVRFLEGLAASIGIALKRRQDEAALRAGEERFRRAVVDSPFPILLHAEDGEILHASNSWCDITGYTREELATIADWDERAYGERKTLVQADMDALYELNDRKHEGDYVIRTKSGGTRIWEFSSAPLGRLPDGRRLVISMATDVTDRKRAEEALRASEQGLRQAQEIGHLGNWDWDIAGEKLVWSDETYRIWGVPRDFPLTYDSVVSLIHPEDREMNAAKVKQLLDSNSRAAWEFRIIVPDGSVRSLRQEAEVSRDDVGNPVRAFGIMQDITERKRDEDQLQAANVRLEQAVAQAEELAVRAEAANRAKSEFLANMSHEIRTPMSAITGFAELLMSGECSARERREHLSTIQRNAESLLTIINDILDLSKIEAERLQLEQMDWPPRQVVEDVETLLGGRANEKHLGLEVTYVDPLPSAIRMDPVRLRQILVNLVGNAIKFTDSGGVHLTVRWIPGRGASSQMQFEVTDSGIGISAEGMKGLFEPFSQVDMSSTRRFGGTGLGLSISQRLAEMLGGRIEVRSELGKGSTFTLTIDAGPAEKAAMPSSPASRKAEDRPLAAVYGSLHGRVLLVEDVLEMTQLMRCTLANTSLELDLAENGVAACEKAMASKAAGEPYDLILMDIRMPVMNGYEATRRLRADGWVGPIVALTAHSMRGDREQCLEAGCNDYLSKPVSQAAFFGVLKRYLGGKNESADQPPEPANPCQSPAEGKLFDGLLDDATVDQLLEEYAATLLVKAEALGMALTTHDLDLLAGLAHELKGVAGMYGFAEVTQKARFLQQLAEKANDLAEVEAHASELIESCRRAAEAGGKNSQRPREQVSDSSPPSSSP